LLSFSRFVLSSFFWGFLLLCFFWFCVFSLFMFVVFELFCLSQEARTLSSQSLFAFWNFFLCKGFFVGDLWQVTCALELSFFSF